MYKLRSQDELTCVCEGNGVMYARKGAMVAYKGEFKFEKVLLDTNKNQGLLQSLGRLAARKLTGENIPIMKVVGSGALYLADNAQHVTVITLRAGQSIGVESENLLAYTENVKYGIRFIGAGVLSQKGMFTSTLTGESDGAQVAIMSNGNPIILDTPCVVDPDAVVCWTGTDPSVEADVSWKTLIGQTSGESYFLKFHSKGETVIVQPAERIGGVGVSVD
ncbi:AIM24 family protein [Lutibacter sp. B2]|nr:AIM24 family protein [Lutibacter sp. B2]